MFEDRMKTSAIPERVYSLCQAVKSRSMLESDLRELLEPSGLGGTTKYFGTVRDAAKQLGLISIKEGNISLAVESKYVYSYDSMREYIICNIDAISDGLFFKVSQEYISMNEQVFRYKGVSEAALVEHMSKMIGFPVYEDDMRAWRFWAKYLGLGNLHDMLLLPNMYQYLKAVLVVIKMKKGEEYTFSDFISAIKPYTEIGLADLDSNKKINLAMSSGLRALHDEGIIQLYKHYEAEVIAGVLDEVILPDDLDSEDYPSFSTMLRWLQWFRENLQRMEGYLRTAGYQILNLGEGFLFSSDSLLDKIRNRYQNWLEQLLRLIYNSGGFLVPVRW